MNRHYSTIRQAADALVPSQFAIPVEEPAYNIPGVYVVDALVARNYTKTFTYYDTDNEPLTAAEALALYWRDTLKTLDDQIKALAYKATVEYNAMNDYGRTRHLTEETDASTETTYGKIDTRSGSASDTTTYNSTVTGDVVTYDATLRDQTKTTRGGSDTNAGTSSSSSTLSGSDTTEGEGSREIVESVTGYSKSPSKNIGEYLDLALRGDLLDFVLGEFEKRYLYYGGDWS